MKLDPGVSQHLLVPVSFCRSQNLYAHLFECWLYQALQGSGLPGPSVEVSSVSFPGPRRAVPLSSLSRWAKPSFSFLAAALFVLCLP